MIGYLLRSFAARWRSEAVLMLLTLASVALGVASVVAIQLLHRSAIASFAAGMSALEGDVDLAIVPDASALDDLAWRVATGDQDVAIALPILDLTVKVRGTRGDKTVFLDLTATDLTFASRLPWAGIAPDRSAPFTTPNFVAITEPMARRLDVKSGDTIEVSLGSRTVSLEIGGLLDLRKGGLLAGDRLAVMDIAAAQEAFGRLFELDRVDLLLAEGADPGAVVERLAKRLPAGCRVLTPKQREAQAEGLLEAFRVNLTALSFVSVFVGMFLVFSAVRAQVVRRRGEFGLLRALGATRGAVLSLALTEVAAIAAVGCALGIPLGEEGARRNLTAVSRTMTDLYLLDAINALDQPWWLVPLALLVGVAGALLAAIEPLYAVARSDPRELLSPRAAERRIDRAAPRLALFAIVLVGGAFGLHAVWLQEWRGSGFLLGVVVLAALPLVMPVVFTRGLSRFGRSGFGFGYAARALSRRVSTGVIAAGALAIAASMLFGITLMVGSFRDTVMRWIKTAIRADVYVASDTFGRSQGDAAIESAAVDRLARDPAVRAVDRQRKTQVWLGERRVTLLGIDAGLPQGEVRFPLVDERDAAAAGRRVAARLLAGGSAMISEPLAIKSKLRVGDWIELPRARSGSSAEGPAAAWRVEIAGIYHDYTSEHGIVVVDLAEFARGMGAGDANSLGIYLKPGASADACIDAWRAELPAALTFTPNERLRNEALRIFDQTFLVTRLLEASSLAVAALGLALGLLILAAERRGEIALYRSLGATRPMIARIFLGKGFAIGLGGVIVGAIGGVLLALILVRVINRSWFGWTITLSFPVAALTRQALTILAAVIGASVYPAILASRESGVELSRDQE